MHGKWPQRSAGWHRTGRGCGSCSSRPSFPAGRPSRRTAIGMKRGEAENANAAKTALELMRAFFSKWLCARTPTGPGVRWLHNDIGGAQAQATDITLNLSCGSCGLQPSRASPAGSSSPDRRRRATNTPLESPLKTPQKPMPPSCIVVAHNPTLLFLALQHGEATENFLG